MKRVLQLNSLLLLVIAANVSAADVSYYTLVKSESYLQTPTTAPTLLSSNGYMANAVVIASTNGVVTNASLRIPSGLSKGLVPETNGTIWRLTEYFNSRSELDSAYPIGSGFNPASYTMSMETVNDGVQTGVLDFWRLPPLLSLGYPAIPQVNNLGAGQSIDTTADFTLSWNAVGSSLDIVQLTILDMASNVVFASPVPLSSNALSGTSTSIVISANTLPPGTNLQAHLTGASPDIPNTSYATGVSAYARDTEFHLVTRPAPVPRLSIVRPSTESLDLSFTAEINRRYYLQRTVDWTNWVDLLVTQPGLQHGHIHRYKCRSTTILPGAGRAISHQRPAKFW